ncbi:hypothetical protein ACQY0O_002002 [Thecaphora frezii]
MGLFGLKTKKSSQSDSSSIRKHTLQASNASSAIKHNPDASDIVGDSPSFNSSPSKNGPRRQDSIASETASLRNRNSANMLKLFGGSASKRRSSRGPADASSPKITQPSEYFGATSRNSTSQNRTSVVDTAPAAASTHNETPKTAETPVAAATPALSPLPTISTPTSDGSLVHAVNKDVPDFNASASPRPSDLFAGKGVQWNEIDLTARDASSSAQPPKAEDLQSFLKARRQWIPTFKTEDSVAEEENLSVDRLENLSFNTTPADKTGGLMSLKDLEESHKRKTALSSQLPIVTGSNGTVFDEAAEGRASTSANLPPRPTAPLKNQSFRTSHFLAEGKSLTNGVTTNGSDLTKSGIGSLSRKPVPNSAEESDARDKSVGSQQRSIPQRRSSMQGSRPDTETNGSDAVAVNGAAVTAEVTASPSVTTTTTFATPETSDAHFPPNVAETAGAGAVTVPHTASPGASAAPQKPLKAEGEESLPSNLGSGATARPAPAISTASASTSIAAAP